MTSSNGLRSSADEAGHPKRAAWTASYRVSASVAECARLILTPLPLLQRIASLPTRGDDDQLELELFPIARDGHRRRAPHGVYALVGTQQRRGWRTPHAKLRGFSHNANGVAPVRVHLGLKHNILPGSDEACEHHLCFVPCV